MKKTVYYFFIIVFIFVFSGCSLSKQNQLNLNKKQNNKQNLTKLLSKIKPKNAIDEKVKIGIVKLQKKDYKGALDIFQEGLRLEPSNGHLHFLNALAYHMNSLNGNLKDLELAKSGYITALKFDKSNYIAAYFLGQIYLDQKKYDQAQNQFAYGLLYSPNNDNLLKAMATASYYAHDLDLSLWASTKAYKNNPKDKNNIRNLLFAKAAKGKFDNIENLIDSYENKIIKTSKGDELYLKKLSFEKVSNRISDWKDYHALNEYSIFGGSDDISDDYNKNNIKKQILKPIDGSKKKNNLNLPKMVHVDVIILRSQEVRSQAKGINLLDGLKATLSGTLYSYGKTKIKTDSETKTTTTTVIYPSFNLMDLEYNLNIFQDEFNKAEILARPSLLATENSTSKFFSGGELHVQLSSNNADGSMVDIPIGITLNVTPQFYDDETIKIAVEAKKSFLEMQSAVVGFTSFSQTTKTTVDATAVMKFGETLMLSGLSETLTEGSNNGVPILKEIPGIQYLFSRDEEYQSKKSILIFLTPRKARYSKDLTKEELNNEMDLEKVYISDLKKKQKIKNTNLNAAISHLSKESDFYRQFRTGDMGVDFWENDDSLYGALKRALGFLYY